jgi:hypothetical protein
MNDAWKLLGALVVALTMLVAAPVASAGVGVSEDPYPPPPNGEEEPPTIIDEDEPDVIIDEDEPDVIIDEDEPDVTIDEDEPDVIIEEDEPSLVTVPGDGDGDGGGGGPAGLPTTGLAVGITLIVGGLLLASGLAVRRTLYPG